MRTKKAVTTLRPLFQVTVRIAGHDRLADNPLTPAAESILAPIGVAQTVATGRRQLVPRHVLHQDRYESPHPAGELGVRHEHRRLHDGNVHAWEPLLQP
jgi:hypothetical protein